MKKTAGFWMVLLMTAFSSAGCSAHSPMIIKNTTDVKSLTNTKFAEHKERVFLTKEFLPAEIGYQEVAQIDVGKVWYGGAEWVYITMAEKARKLGADGVMQISTWHQPAGWAWSTPQGSGKAIKFNDSHADLSKVQGEWR